MSIVEASNEEGSELVAGLIRKEVVELVVLDEAVAEASLLSWQKFALLHGEEAGACAFGHDVERELFSLLGGKVIADGTDVERHFFINYKF